MFRGVAIAVALAASTWAQEGLSDHSVPLKPADLIVVEDGSASRWEHRLDVDFDGVLHVWTSSGELLGLRARQLPDGATRTGAGTGGGTTPYLRLDVRAGSSWYFEILRTQSGPPQPAELVLRVSPEDEEGRDVAAYALDELGEIRGLAARGDFDEARERLREVAQVVEETARERMNETLDAACEQVAAVGWELGIADAVAPTYLRIYEHRSRVLPPGHEGWMAAVMGAGLAFDAQGRTDKAVAIQRDALEARLGTHPRPDDHWRVAMLYNVVNGLQVLRELEQAVEVNRELLETLETTAPPEHPQLLKARLTQAGFDLQRGELSEARRQIASVLELVDPKDQLRFDIQIQALTHLALVEKECGNLWEARRIEESALVRLRSRYPPEHRFVLMTEFNLAKTFKLLGDLRGAYELEQHVLEVWRRAASEDHPQVLLILQNMASTLEGLGEAEAAVEIERRVLEGRLARHGPDHADVLETRVILADGLRRAGHLDEALEHGRLALQGFEQTLGPDHLRVQSVRRSLANTLLVKGEVTEAAELYRSTLASLERAAPRDHPDQRDTRRGLLTACLLAGRDAEAERLAAQLAGDLRDALASAAGAMSGRELEQLALSLMPVRDTLLNRMGDASDPDGSTADPHALEAVIALRAASLVGARVRQSREDAAKSEDLDRRIADAVAELRRAVSAGTDGAAEARRRVDRLERERSELQGSRAALEALGAGDVLARLAARTPADEALVSYVAYPRQSLRPGAPYDAYGTLHLAAFVLRSDGSARRFELGAVEELRADVLAWRSALLGEAARDDARGVGVGIGAARSSRVAGRRLRQRVLDPLAPALEEVRRVTVVPDDVLHLVPLDALPAQEEASVVGDTLQIQERMTLRELTVPAPTARREGHLLLVGDVDYGRFEAAEEAAAEGQPVPVLDFPELPGARAEVAAISELWRVNRDGPVEALSGAGVTRALLRERAGGCAWFHIASHGWFVGLDGGLGVAGPRGRVPTRLDDASAAYSSSPLLLCGLALSGANSAGGTGAVGGTISGAELAALDLTGCELAVLSACDTGVGEWRTSQGLASLQKALHLAGARVVLASRWKISDQAARHLMEEFYRRVWSEGERLDHALWAAKKTLRDARDGQGRPLYAPRDWAGWVLTGSPE